MCKQRLILPQIAALIPPNRSMQIGSGDRGTEHPRSDLCRPAPFINAQNMAMTRAGFESILAKHGGTAARKSLTLVDRPLSPHLSRHSCAGLMLWATQGIRSFALGLGRADIRTTEITSGWTRPKGARPSRRRPIARTATRSVQSARCVGG